MTVRISSFARSRNALRRTCVAIVAVQAIAPVPTFAETIVERVYSTVYWTTNVASDSGSWAREVSGHMARHIERRVADYQASNVPVNRTPPKVLPPPLMPTFSNPPTDAEIQRARVFEEPLLPTGGQTTPEENRALAAALLDYLRSGGSDRVAPLLRFLQSFPGTAWRASVLLDLGLVYRRTGHFSRALDVWNDAWALAKSGEDRNSRAIGDRAVGELFELNSRLGRFDELERLFQEIDGRDVRGSASQKVSNARQALWLMRNKPGESFRCGPLALNEILKFGNPQHQTPEPIELCQSTDKGTSLAAMQQLAMQVGLRMQAAQRTPGSAVLVPAMVHWKVGHFAALVMQEGDRILMRDPTFGDELWLTRATLDEEASGFFLVPDAPLPTGWQTVAQQHAGEIWGKGIVAGIDQDDHDDCPQCGGQGMAVVNIHMLQISVNLRDVPIWYTPATGPSADFAVSYRQREASQPQTFSYANLGAKWTFHWLAYIEDDPTNPSAAVSVYQRGGGKDTSTGYDSSTGRYSPTVRKQAVVARTSSSPIRYERQLPDGSLEVYAQADGASSFPRKVFLTEVRDPQGNALHFTWDASLRIVAATDALGQVTTVSYELQSDPLKITKITDPFNRTATFAYDVDGRLQSITDLLGLQSAFTYGTSDTIATVTTPYGVTRITTGEDGIKRWAEITDPMGGRERVQYGAAVVAEDPLNTLPQGMAVSNELSHHNTLYWDKVAMAKAPGDPASAIDYSWMRKANVSVAAMQAIKRPLENRVWYNYQGGSATEEGTVRKVSAQGRVLDDGTTQLTRSEYNTRGQIIKRIDPVGRETIYEYDATGLDLVRVKQKNGAGYDLLETRTYNSQHLPLTITDAAGQTTTYTYNAAGQVLTVTNAKNKTTTYAYNGNGQLTSVTGPVPGATTTYTYDGFGRVRTVTDSDNYTLTYDYDSANRPTRVTFPDGTYEQTTYDRLDAAERRDRLGRITRLTYDGARRVAATTDPAGRTITQVWCACGSLDALIDANGNRTRWERDVQGRVEREVRADGTTDTLYTYDLAGRLRMVTDPRDQVTTYSYRLDDALASTVYTNAPIATPSVTFTYDAAYPRMATMVDGTGTTTYAYQPVGQLGGGQTASVDGPLTNDTITYSYDELGRVTSRALNGTANTVTWSFDALGRTTNEANVLGTFTYTYDGQTNRIASVAYPNKQTSTYSYLPNAQDHRLQTIHHRLATGATLSKFDYTYDMVGNIQTWRQQADAAAVLWRYRYDGADQLASAVKESTDATPQVLKRFGYVYDPAGNRTVEQIDDTISLVTTDKLNRLVTQVPGGALVFAGTVNEPATVTIQGKPALVDATNQFRGTATVTSGTNTVTIVATDPAGNTTSKQWTVDIAGQSKTFTYDANGNLTADGSRTFEWDARNQLVAVTVAAHRTEFTYDGLQRRVRMVEKENGAVQTDTRVIWCETMICEERRASDNAMTRRVFALGEEVAVVTVPIPGLPSETVPTPRYFAADHLGSVTEVTDSANILLARYAYDSWGRRTLTAGTDITSVGYTGHRWHSNGSVSLTLYRAYDADFGQWLSEDPLGLNGGVNLYRYADARPVSSTDPLGLVSVETSAPIIRYVKLKDMPGGRAVCGTLKVNASFRGNCDCVDGGYRATLRISYKPEIYIATDVKTSTNRILAHEMQHHADNLKAIDAARVDGEKLERKTFGSESACKSAVDAWAARAASLMGRKAFMHDLWDFVFNPCKL